MRGIVKKVSRCSCIEWLSIQLVRAEALSICGETVWLNLPDESAPVCLAIWFLEGEIYFEAIWLKHPSIREHRSASDC